MEVIGTVEDIKRQGIIYFVWSAKGFHHILLDKDNGEDASVILLDTSQLPVTPLVEGTSLNFQRTARIKANVVGDMLYWTDGVNPPRKVNIEKAIKTGLQQAGGYPFISESVISAIKFAPITPPKIYFDSDPSIKGNNVRGKQYQFKYRFVYDDNEISICSPASKCAISNDSYNINGELITPIYDNNVIKVSVYTGDVNVKNIQLLTRENGVADWFIIADIKKAELNNISAYTYSFYNAEAFTAVDQEDTNRQYEYLPDLADTQEFIDGKYMAYGGITEGKDLIEVHVDLVPDKFVVKDVESEGGIDFVVEQASFQFEYNGVNGLEYIPVYYSKIFGINTGVPEGKIIYIKVFMDGEYNATIDTIREYKTVASDIDPIELRRHIAEQITSTQVATAVTGQSNGLSMVVLDIMGTFVNAASVFNEEVPADEIWVFPNYSQTGTLDNSSFGLNLSIRNPATALISMNVFNAVKTFAYHRFGLIYIDRYGKKSTVNKNEGCEVYIPSAVNLGVTTNNVAANIRWDINHQPPVWAHAYQWVYAGSSIERYVQYVIGGGISPTVERSSDGTYVYISIYALNRLTIQNPDGVEFTNMGTSVIPYQFTKGDRIRIITQQVDSEVIDDQFPSDILIPEDIDMEVLGYTTETLDGVEVTIDKLKVKDFDYEALLVGSGSIVEIYTPRKKTENDIYYEIGESYPILNAGTKIRSHGGQLSNQVFETVIAVDPITEEEVEYTILKASAKGLFIKAGAYVITRNIPFTINKQVINWNAGNDKLFFCESMQFNDYFESYGLDKGNPNIYDPDARSTKTNTLRRSKAYFEGTKTNGLSTFYYDDYITLTSKWGRITAMEMIGGTLKILFERKQTSVYIGANNLKQARQSGIDVIVANDNVFGGINESEDQYGTKAPESAIVVGRHLYFYDESNSCIVRDAANGPVNISAAYGMRAWLDRIEPILKTSTYKRIVSGYSPKYDELWMSFYAENAEGVTLSETIVFDCREQGSGFIFVDLKNEAGKTADAYCSLGKELYSFQEAQCYKHDDGNPREFYGVKYPYVVEFFSNINPATRKLFLAIAENSSALFYAPNDGDIKIDSGYQNAQPTSKLFAANFVKQEGVFYAPINRNARYKTGFYTIDSLYNGEPMRGESMNLRLSCDSDEAVILHSIIVKCRVSEKT